EQRQDLVCSDALSGEKLRSRLTEFFRFKPTRFKRQRAPLDKALGRAVIAQQLFDLAAQVRVSRTGFGQKGRALVRLAFQRGVIKLLNLLPSFRLHPAFLHAAGAATTIWPIASRGEPCSAN